MKSDITIHLIMVVGTKDSRYEMVDLQKYATYFVEAVLFQAESGNRQCVLYPALSSFDYLSLNWSRFEQCILI